MPDAGRGRVQGWIAACSRLLPLPPLRDGRPPAPGGSKGPACAPEAPVPRIPGGRGLRAGHGRASEGPRDPRRGLGVGGGGGQCTPEAITPFPVALQRGPLWQSDRLALGGGVHCRKLPKGQCWLPPPPCVTFRQVAVSLQGPGQSPLLPFACCIGSMLSDGSCGLYPLWCCCHVSGAQQLAYWGLCWWCHREKPPPPPNANTRGLGGTGGAWTRFRGPT